MSEETSKQNESQKENKKGFFEEATEKVGDSFKSAGDAASELADDIKEKTGTFTDSLLEKIKKGTQEVMELSAKFFDTLTIKANDYAEKYKDRVEMIRLKRERDELYNKLGAAIYEKKETLNLSMEETLNLEELKEYITKIDQKAEQIIEHGENIDKNKKAENRK